MTNRLCLSHSGDCGEIACRGVCGTACLFWSNDNSAVGKMGIRFFCPRGHKLNVKSYQAGQRGICPVCGAKVQIPWESTRPGSKGPEATPGAAQNAPGKSESMGVPVPSEILPVGPAPSTQPFHSGQQRPASGGTAPSTLEKAADAASGDLPKSPIPLSGGPADAPAAAGMPSDLDLAGSAEDATAVPMPAPAPAGADPLSEAPDMVWYVRPPSGGQYGPAPGQTMRAWVEEGRVPPDSLVWREGWRDWQQASATFAQLRTDEESEQLAAIGSRSVLPGKTAGGRQDRPRPRSASPNVRLIILLALAAIIVFAIFLWVLLSGPTSVTVTGSVGSPAAVVSGLVAGTLVFGPGSR